MRPREQTQRPVQADARDALDCVVRVVLPGRVVTAGVLCSARECLTECVKKLPPNRQFTEIVRTRPSHFP